MEVVKIGYPVAQDGVTGSSDGVLGIVFQVLSLHGVIIIGSGKGSTKDRGAGTSDLIQGNTSIFEGFVDSLQKHTLLGIHGFGLPPGYTKELGVEQSKRLIEEVAILGIDLVMK